MVAQGYWGHGPVPTKVYSNKIESTFCNEMLSRRSGLRNKFGSFAFHKPPLDLLLSWDKASACFRESCIPDSVRCLGEACLARAYSINNNFLMADNVARVYMFIFC